MGHSFLEIDGERLLQNVRLFRGVLGSDTKLMAVVKANAYGHGARLVASLLRGRVDWFGVDSLEEAEEIASAGVSEPVLIMGHTEPAEAGRIVSGGFRQVLFRRDMAEAISRAATEQTTTARVHVKVETGLNRLGVDPRAIAGLIEGLEGLSVEGLYTHFADVEDPASTLYQRQIDALLEAAAQLSKSGKSGKSRESFLHAFPTAGALLHPAESLGIARVGIGLYGIWPSPATRRGAAGIGTLAPVLSWKSRVAQVKTVPAGGTVGYDVTYRATTSRRIAVVPVGYADGFDRGLSNRGSVLVRGRRAPVVGRVAMNMFMIDVTDSDAQEGDEVVLLGEQLGASMTADEMAESIGTIAYEVLARLSPRLTRRLI